MPGVSLKKPKGFGCRVETQQVVGGRLRCGRPIVGVGSYLNRTDLGDFGGGLGSGKDFSDSGSVGLVVGVFLLQVHADVCAPYWCLALVACGCLLYGTGCMFPVGTPWYSWSWGTFLGVVCHTLYP